MVCCISFVACCVEDVSKVTGTLGAVVGSSLCWICPSSVYLKLSQKGRSSLSQPLTNGLLKVYTSFLARLRKEKKKVPFRSWWAPSASWWAFMLPLDSRSMIGHLVYEVWSN